MGCLRPSEGTPLQAGLSTAAELDGPSNSLQHQDVAADNTEPGKPGDIGRSLVHLNYSAIRTPGDTAFVLHTTGDGRDRHRARPALSRRETPA